MGVPRRLSSRLSGSRISLLRNSQKAELKKEKEAKEAIKRKRKPFDVNVQILTGRVIQISISPDDTIEEVTFKIKAKEGINPDHQILLFNGIKMAMDGLVDEYRIQEHVTLFLTLRNGGG